MTGVPIDPMLRQLGRLTLVEPDPTHSAAVRARCHAALARQLRRQKASTDRRLSGSRPVELALAATFSVIYLSGVIRSALAIYGAF
jgi:hypothetical protein